jgi:hypothetical protein
MVRSTTSKRNDAIQTPPVHGDILLAYGENSALRA